MNKHLHAQSACSTAGHSKRKKGKISNLKIFPPLIKSTCKFYILHYIYLFFSIILFCIKRKWLLIHFYGIKVKKT